MRVRARAGLFAGEEALREGHRGREPSRAAAKLAAKLQELGLRKTPEFLIDYSVGDYSGMANKIHTLAELFLDGDGPVLAEVDSVFRNVLDAKLKTEEGRAFIAAKLAEVTKAVAPVVTAAVATAATVAA